MVNSFNKSFTGLRLVWIAIKVAPALPDVALALDF